MACHFKEQTKRYYEGVLGYWKIKESVLYFRGTLRRRMVSNSSEINSIDGFAIRTRG